MSGAGQNHRIHLSNALLNARQFPTIRVTGSNDPVDARNSAMLDLTGNLCARR